MLQDIKRELLKSPETIAKVLEHYNYAHIKIRDEYMSFGRDINSSPKSIVIRLNDNDWLYVKDYPRNINTDLFSYIIQQRGVTFNDVMTTVKNCLGVSDYYSLFKSKNAFNSFYASTRPTNKEVLPLKIYQKEVLSPYKQIGNLRFLRDKISLETQRFFDIRYDVENSGIVIPILDQTGELIAVKERINREPGPDEQKYWYVIPGRESRTLYGYCQNYKYLVNNTVYIFESEKSCMQCHSYGIRNCVSLGSGSLSRDQTKMLYELQPKKVIFLHDYGYEAEYIMKNINTFKRNFLFSDIETGYWDWTNSDFTEKVSPSDLGKNELKRIIDEEVIYV